jgi:plasmid maintenance system antidote protein VapI
MIEPRRPGLVIRELLDSNGILLSKAADDMGVSRTFLSYMVNGSTNNNVTQNMASRLEGVFIGTSKEYWAELGRNYCEHRKLGRIESERI